MEKAKGAGLSGQRRYWASVGLFALALLSKSMAVSLPVVLLVLDVYPLRRLGGRPGGWLGPAALRVWIEKAPFALLSLGASIVAVVAQLVTQGSRPLVMFGWLERVSISLYSLAFYLWKMLGRSTCLQSTSSRTGSTPWPGPISWRRWWWRR